MAVTLAELDAAPIGARVNHEDGSRVHYIKTGDIALGWERHESYGVTGSYRSSDLAYEWYNLEPAIANLPPTSDLRRPTRAQLNAAPVGSRVDFNESVFYIKREDGRWDRTSYGREAGDFAVDRFLGGESTYTLRAQTADVVTAIHPGGIDWSTNEHLAAYKGFAAVVAAQYTEDFGWCGVSARERGAVNLLSNYNAHEPQVLAFQATLRDKLEYLNQEYPGDLNDETLAQLIEDLHLPERAVQEPPAPPVSAPESAWRVGDFVAHADRRQVPIGTFLRGNSDISRLYVRSDGPNDSSSRDAEGIIPLERGDGRFNTSGYHIVSLPVSLPV